MVLNIPIYLFCNNKFEVPWKQLCYGPVHMVSQVSSLTHVSKSQHGGKVPTFEPQENIKIWLIIIKVGSWLFYAEIFTGLALRVGSSSLLDPTFNTSPEPHLQKVLPCRHPCHTWDLGLGTRVKSQLPCSQRLRLHRLTSSDLGLRSWDLCELALRYHLSCPIYISGVFCINEQVLTLRNNWLKFYTPWKLHINFRGIWIKKSRRFATCNPARSLVHTRILWLVMPKSVGANCSAFLVTIFYQEGWHFTGYQKWCTQLHNSAKGSQSENRLRGTWENPSETARGSSREYCAHHWNGGEGLHFFFGRVAFNGTTHRQIWWIIISQSLPQSRMFLVLHCKIVLILRIWM